MKLFDRADGCRGHFCIGRMSKNPPYWEFWNETYEGGTWCSAGTVYVGQEKAKSKMAELKDEIDEYLEGWKCSAGFAPREK